MLSVKQGFQNRFDMDHIACLSVNYAQTHDELTLLA